MNFKRITNITGWIVFAIAAVVFYLSAERTGSLWDCGEFILGAYKLQVVHPPGAPLFLVVGRLFTYAAELFSNNPEDIAFAVNLMSGLCTAFAGMFVCWVTIHLGKISLVGREGKTDDYQNLALGGSGLVAGLATAFCTSIWFSAVEGEVYAMSTFFTALTLWSTIKWYSLPDNQMADRWLLFTFYSAGLSIGVHLLSILTFPALAIFYYFKKYKQHTFLGIVAAGGIGVAIIILIQSLIITGIPNLWAFFELLMVNSLGFGFHSGLIPTLAIVAGIILFGLRYAHQKQNHLVQHAFIAATLVVIGFSTIGVVVTRANANPPVNMNAPSDAMRLLPYLNREQYGERALLNGPHFEASPIKTEANDRYGRVGDRYEIVDQKLDVIYDDKDKMFFPRMGDGTQNRGYLYKQWMGLDNPQAALPAGRPNFFDNIAFLWNYQVKWMYWRYFMWNFAGRQNGEQGYYPWDKSKGHWISGIPFVDDAKLFDQSILPDTLKEDKSRNKYYMLPFIFGLIGLFFHFKHRNNDALGLLALFVITGLGIIIYSNQPPNEPRERDYVLVGSFFTYCIWMGMAVLALFNLFRERIKLSGPVGATLASVLVLTAPILMGVQNFDDHTRRHNKGSRDYASNFLNSCQKDAIIFTYGDNDTYPLWYAQEVEGIRPDVRVVNLSLIAVDWYIDLLRRKVNESEPIKMTIPKTSYRGNKRNMVYYYNPSKQNPEVELDRLVNFIGEDHPLPTNGGGQVESFYSTNKAFIPVDSNKVYSLGIVDKNDSTINLVNRIPLQLGDRFLSKDEIAILDIVASNLWDRPIYFAVTCRADKLFGLQDYMQLEGLALRIVPFKTKSDPAYGVVGSGRVNRDAFYDNVMNKFKWGNFDGERDVYIDNSYMPSIQSMQLGMRRAALDFIRIGDYDKAVDLADKYFQSFPHHNFSYDFRTYYMIDIYFAANAYEKSKPYLEKLTDELLDYLAFYDALDVDVLRTSFQSEYGATYQTLQNIISQVRGEGDEDFAKQLEDRFNQYRIDGTENNPLPN